MAITTTSLEELRGREEAAFARFVALIAELPPQAPVGDGTWNVGQVATHLLTVMRRYTVRDFSTSAGLSATVAGVNAQNQDELEALTHLTPAEVLDQLADEQQRFLALEWDLEAAYPFHFNQKIDGYGGWGNLIGELLVHGYDVATSTGRPWPIEARDALLILNAAFQVAPGVANPEVTRELTASFEFRVKGGRRHTLLIDRGSASMVETAQDAGRPDVILGGSPAPMLLNLYGRLSTPRAALKGVGIRGGRRPWLGLRLAKIFEMRTE